MTDWYLNITELPSLSKSITDYIDGLKPHKSGQWSYTSKNMKKYKKELLDELLRIQNERCVYCGLSFTSRLIDREHFVPKGKNQAFTFHEKNIFAACAHCNRRLKGRRSVIKEKNDIYENCIFSVIHPYLDNPNDYLEYELDDKDRPVFIRAKPTDCKKGEETIKFFQLSTVAMVRARRGYLAEREDSDDDIRAIIKRKP